jgi:hypothetical protein
MSRVFQIFIPKKYQRKIHIIVNVSGLFFIFFNFPFLIELNAQSLPVNTPVLEEYIRRSQLFNDSYASSFMSRPLTTPDSIFPHDLNLGANIFFKGKNNFLSPKLKVLPLFSSTLIGGNIPYPEVSNFVLSKGIQQYLTAGIFSSFGLISIQINPEFIFSQNLEYDIGVAKSGGTEFLERFGNDSFSTILPGNTSLRLNFWAFSLGASTENIWWGPGQFNSLLFSNNAFGFQHLTLNTRRPAQTFLGSFEGQLIAGKLRGAYPDIVQITNLKDDWRYLNGLTISYQPKWIKGFYLGFSRVFQQYNSNRTNSFRDLFPIFEAFQKESLVENVGNSLEFDERGHDQQLTGFVRYIIPRSNIELYFEYGRRDHALNWREAILNPEHARAYIFGFKKLFEIQNDAYIQIRGEALQQQESINILIRYPGTEGGGSWGSHGWIPHGFTHRGQMLGPGVGPSSNVQTLETAWVKGFKKVGIRLERLNRHQDIYQKRFLDPSEQGRWVDLSARLLADWQFDNLIISSNINFVNSLNYQWQLDPYSTPEYPRGENLFSVHSQVSLIYLFQ